MPEQLMPAASLAVRVAKDTRSPSLVTLEHAGGPRTPEWWTLTGVYAHPDLVKKLGKLWRDQLRRTLKMQGYTLAWRCRFQVKDI